MSSSIYALNSVSAGSSNPLLREELQSKYNKGFNGRVPLNANERLPGYALFAADPVIGSKQPGTVLIGDACNTSRTFHSLEQAKQACLQSSCCGGITQTHAHSYALKASGTPIVSSNAQANSWVKEQNGNRSTDAGESANEQLRTLQTVTPLSEAYFSNANQEILQNAIRRGVYDKTSKVIDKQDYLQLQIVMRSIYLQYSRNDNSSANAIRQQIIELNKKVIDYCVPITVSNLQQYVHYRQDVSKMPVPMAYGLATSNKGSMSLALKPFV